MDYEKYEKIKDMYLGTWEALITRMPSEDKRYTLFNDNKNAASLSKWGNQMILKLFTFDSGKLQYSISYDTESKYCHTFDETGIRIALWQDDYPRYYALHDPDNSREGNDYTFIEYPFPEEYFFQRMTVQETLPEEDYKLWDDVSELQRAVLEGHPALSIGMVLKDFSLTPDEVLDLLVPFLEGEYDIDYEFDGNYNNRRGL